MSVVGDEAAEAAVPSPVELLLAVQDEDLRIDQLAYRLTRLPSRLRLDELAARERALVAERRRIEAARVPLDSDLQRLEAEVAECDARSAAIERRLRTADSGSFRDQEAMSAEIGSIAARKHRLEDEELVALEALEPLEEALARIEESEHDIDVQREAATADLSVEEADLAAERGLAAERRASAIAVVPPALRTEYERLRSRLSGIGVARIVHGTCGGCNLSLSATELDRVRRGGPDEVMHCEQCGRILVP